MHRAHAPGACTRRMHGRMHRAHAPGAHVWDTHRAHVSLYVGVGCRCAMPEAHNAPATLDGTILSALVR